MCICIYVIALPGRKAFYVLCVSCNMCMFTCLCVCAWRIVVGTSEEKCNYFSAVDFYAFYAFLRKEPAVFPNFRTYHLIDQSKKLEIFKSNFFDLDSASLAWVDKLGRLFKIWRARLSKNKYFLVKQIPLGSSHRE